MNVLLLGIERKERKKERATTYVYFLTLSRRDDCRYFWFGLSVYWIVSRPQKQTAAATLVLEQLQLPHTKKQYIRITHTNIMVRQKKAEK